MYKLIIKKQWLILLILFSGVSGIFGSWGFYFLLLLYPVLLYKTNVIKFVDSSFLWLVIFSLSFTIIWSYNSSFEPGKTIYYIFYPPLFYLIGGYFAEKSSNSNSIIRILLILIIAYSFIYLKNAIYDTINYGLINTHRSIVVYNDSILGAYYQQVRASLAIAGIGLLFVPTQVSTEKRLKFIFILLSFFGLFATIHFVNRTGLALALFSILFVSFKLIKNKSALILLFLFGILLIFTIDYLANLTNVQLFIESYQSRELNRESSLSTFGGRIVRWKWVLDNIFIHPWGQTLSSEYGYAHNLWLDSARLGGIIPFFSLIIFTILSIYRVIKLLFSNNLPLFFNCLLITLNLTFFLQSFIEPILESDPVYFWLYTMFLGMQSIMYKNLRVKKLDKVKYHTLS